MNLKERIAKYLRELMAYLHVNQSEMAELLGVPQQRISKYLQAKELPRAEVLIRMADLGGVSLDDLLRPERPVPEPKLSDKDIERINIQLQNVKAGGDVNVGKEVKVIKTEKVVEKHEWVPGENAITAQQARRLQELVEQIVELEQIVSLKPKSYGAVWSAFKKKFKVPTYKALPKERFPEAEAYLMRWIGRLKSRLAYADPERWRKDRRKAIYFTAVKVLGMTDEEFRDLMQARYGVRRLHDLDDDQLESFYRYLMNLKNKSEG